MDIRQNAATMGIPIRIITAIVLAATAGTVAAGLFYPKVLIVAAFLALICAGCYALAPVAYALSGNRLIVYRHLGAAEFAPVVRCSRISDHLPWLGLRLFGNGGLFAGTGIYWSRALGIFHAYVTTAGQNYVLVETQRQRILISPEDADQFVAAWERER